MPSTSIPEFASPRSEQMFARAEALAPWTALVGWTTVTVWSALAVVMLIDTTDAPAAIGIITEGYTVAAAALAATAIGLGLVERTMRARAIDARDTDFRIWLDRAERARADASEHRAAMGLIRTESEA